MRLTTLALLAALLLAAVTSAQASPLIFALHEGKTDEATKLINSGADVNEPDEQGFTPIMVAAFYGNKPIVELLLQKGALINHGVPEQNPLLLALEVGNTAMARLLVEKGADPSARRLNGFNALMYASTLGDNALVKLLLEKGADPTAMAYNRNAFDYAVSVGMFEAAELIKATGKINVPPPIDNPEELQAHLDFINVAIKEILGYDDIDEFMVLFTPDQALKHRIAIRRMGKEGWERELTSIEKIHLPADYKPGDREIVCKAEGSYEGRKVTREFVFVLTPTNEWKIKSIDLPGVD